jgi:hypothetical protein
MNPALNPYRDKLQKLRGRLNDPDYAPNVNRIQKKINFIRKKAGVDPRDWSTWKAPYSAPQPAATPALSQDQTQDYWKMLLPGMKTLDNYQSTPLYNWQKQQMKDELGAWSANAGIRGSGAEGSLLSKGVAQLGAQEAERAQQVAEQHANRLWEVINTEAQMKQAASEGQWDRVMDIMNWLSEQNPIRYTYGAQGETAQIQADQAAKMAQMMAGMYGQAYPMLEKAIPPFVAPYPSKPDYTAANQAAASGGGGSSIISSILNGLF